MVDWSARSAPSPVKETKDAIYIGVARETGCAYTYHRTRLDAISALETLLDAELQTRRRVLVGFDFPLSYPKGFAKIVTGSDDPLKLWEALAARIEDDARNRNNRFDVAEDMNGLLPGIGPFWGCSAKRSTQTLPMKGTLRSGHGMAEKRRIEELIPRAQPCWKLMGNGSVGSQALLGIPHLQGLRERYGSRLSVSPFEPPSTPIVLAEIYPGLLDAAIKATYDGSMPWDAHQVVSMARAFSSLTAEHLHKLLTEGDAHEGWILGLGAEAALNSALRL